VIDDDECPNESDLGRGGGIVGLFVIIGFSLVAYLINKLILK